MIGSQGKACVVDPQRDVDQYIDTAAENGLKIEYIIETHSHADFVGGHKELAERTGAQILFGKAAKASVAHRSVQDGDEISLGKAKLKVLETPGHTLDSICILVSDLEQSDKPNMVLTGDTLFIGDVGRPDLAGSQGFTSEHMAGLLYDTLHNKLLKLDDEVMVYPAHGAGSLCGKNLSSERCSTIGNQRRFNYALQEMSKDDFVAMLCADLPEVPAYFPVAVAKNQEGAAALRDLAPPEPLSPERVNELMRKDQVVIDVRPGAVFGAGHIPGSINIGLGGQFASWTGALVPIGTSMVLVVENEDNLQEAITRLARAGHETVIGYLDGGVDAWRKAGFKLAEIPHISVDEFKDKMNSKAEMQIIDVRRIGEYKAGHVPGAAHLSLAELHERLGSIDSSRPTYIVCASGYRSSIATCIIRKRYPDIKICNIAGGTNAWRSAGYDVEGTEKTAGCASS